MAEQLTPEQLKAMRVDSFKLAIKDMIATSKNAYERTDSRELRVRERLYDKDEINRIVVEGSAVERAQLSEHFFTVSGLYKRIILHYAAFLTYSWILVPHKKNPKDKLNDKKISKAYYEASDFCTTFQVERKCATFAKDILVKGAYYGLLRDSGEKVVIQDLPFDFCRTRFKNHDDMQIIELNLKFFDTIRDETLRKEILKTYPQVIQRAYYNYTKKRKDNWFFIPAELGIYFNFFDERPFFLDLIPLLDDLDDYKEIDKKRNLQALKHIIVQKVGTDGLKLIFEPEEAMEMHEGVLEMLSNNDDLDVITTYNDIDVLHVGNDTDDATEVDKVQDLIYESAGISKELFCATTDAGLQYSLNNDLSMMMILAYKFANFFTVLLNLKFSTKKIKFKLSILPISHYNNSEYTSRAKDLAAFGYSFLTPILSTGLDQTNLSDLKELENELLELDEVLKPLQSAYTQSGKTNAITAAASKNAENQAKAETKDDEEKKEQETDKEDKETDTNDNGGE